MSQGSKPELSYHFTYFSVSYFQSEMKQILQKNVFFTGLSALNSRPQNVEQATNKKVPYTNFTKLMLDITMVVDHLLLKEKHVKKKKVKSLLFKSLTIFIAILEIQIPPIKFKYDRSPWISFRIFLIFIFLISVWFLQYDIFLLELFSLCIFPQHSLSQFTQ